MPAAVCVAAFWRAAMSRVPTSRLCVSGALCVATATPISAAPEPARLRVVRRVTEIGVRACDAARALAGARPDTWASTRSASRTVRRLAVEGSLGPSSGGSKAPPTEDGRPGWEGAPAGGASEKNTPSTWESSSKEEKCLFIVGPTPPSRS